MGKSGNVQVIDLYDRVVGKTIRRAVGTELRQARERCGWSRNQLSSRLPSGVGERTILAYELGSRNLQMVRFVELCQVLSVSASGLLTIALQRARINLNNIVLLVDLGALLDDHSTRARPLHPWARNKIHRQGTRIAHVSPTTVDELADCCGYDRQALGDYLATFVPAKHPPLEDAPDEIAIRDAVHTTRR
jgi:transcriptional regulator with XRE-family HTH domain